MPDRKTVETFVRTVQDGQYLEAIERYYAQEASMRENGGEPRRGVAALLENERQVMARFGSIKASLLGPIAIEGDHVAIPWVFEFGRPDGGRVRLEEIAWQRWSGDKVVEERFFYDPAQLAAPVPA
jgi:hypothetical protein